MENLVTEEVGGSHVLRGGDVESYRLWIAYTPHVAGHPTHWERDARAKGRGATEQDALQSAATTGRWVNTTGITHPLDAVQDEVEPSRMLPADLKESRGVLGLSQQALADLLGVRRDTLARWESGRDPIPYAVPGELDEAAVARVTAIRNHFKF